MHDEEFLNDRVMDQDLKDNAEEYNEENECAGSFAVPTESKFDCMSLRSINSSEGREDERVIIRIWIGATGNKLVHVILNVGAGNIAQLDWVADSTS